MNKQYEYERFKSFHEACDWMADRGNITVNEGKQVIYSSSWTAIGIKQSWHKWQKAIEITPEKRMIEVWVNVYNGSTCIYGSEERAMQNNSLSIGTIKLSKEITIIDGKVVDECQ